MRYLCIRRSRPLYYRFREYPLYEGKLNLSQPISASSGSRATVFTIMGVTSEGVEEVASMSRLNFLLYYFREMVWAWYGRDKVMAAR